MANRTFLKWLEFSALRYQYFVLIAELALKNLLKTFKNNNHTFPGKSFERFKFSCVIFPVHFFPVVKAFVAFAFHAGVFGVYGKKGY